MWVADPSHPAFHRTGLRPIDGLKEYFRAYRAKRKEQVRVMQSACCRWGLRAQLFVLLLTVAVAYRQLQHPSADPVPCNVKSSSPPCARQQGIEAPSSVSGEGSGRKASRRRKARSARDQSSDDEESDLFDEEDRSCSDVPAPRARKAPRRKAVSSTPSSQCTADGCSAVMPEVKAEAADAGRASPLPSAPLAQHASLPGGLIDLGLLSMGLAVPWALQPAVMLKDEAVQPAMAGLGPLHLPDRAPSAPLPPLSASLVMPALPAAALPETILAVPVRRATRNLAPRLRPFAGSLLPPLSKSLAPGRSMACSGGGCVVADNCGGLPDADLAPIPEGWAPALWPAQPVGWRCGGAAPALDGAGELCFVRASLDSSCGASGSSSPASGADALGSRPESPGSVHEQELSVLTGHVEAGLGGMVAAASGTNLAASAKPEPAGFLAHAGLSAELHSVGLGLGPEPEAMDHDLEVAWESFLVEPEAVAMSCH
jgi:hypothetical protein